jgi:hypothetical protein
MFLVWRTETIPVPPSFARFKVFLQTTRIGVKPVRRPLR